jgi:hypothetical protein
MNCEKSYKYIINIYLDRSEQTLLNQTSIEEGTSRHKQLDMSMCTDLRPESKQDKNLEQHHYTRNIETTLLKINMKTF